MPPSRKVKRSKGPFRFDWIIIVVAVTTGALLFASLFLAGSTRDDTPFGTTIGGLRALKDSETLVLFEDYTFDSGGWSDGLHDDTHPGLGGILGPFPLRQALERELALPDDVVRAVLSFDLIAIDDWALETVSVSVDGEVLLRRRFSTRPDLSAGQDSEIRSGGNAVVVIAPEGMPVERGFATGGPEMFEQIVRVQIALDTPQTRIDIRVEGEGDVGDDERSGAPQWALDNLILTTETLVLPLP